MKSFSLSEAQLSEFCAFIMYLGDLAACETMPFFRQSLTIDNKEKKGFDPVTEADRRAEAALRRAIEAHYPTHSIDGEEYGKKSGTSPFTWVIDPIDGTRAFISGLPLWGSLIALCYQGKPVIGLLDQPYLKERYLGRPGGSFLNGKPIHTRACPQLAQASLTTTAPEIFLPEEAKAFQKLQKASRMTRYGLDCYGYAMVALGHMDMVCEASLAPYDIMALAPILEGAGGLIVTWQGAAVGEKPGKSNTALALGDRALLEAALALLQQEA